MSPKQDSLQGEFFDDLLGDFLDESDRLLARLNENLLELDSSVAELAEAKTPRRDQCLNEMFRAAHSLKGLSAMFGFDRVNVLTHKMENIFDAARKGDLRLERHVVETVFQSLDLLSALIEALKTPDAEPVECDSVIESIRQLLEAAGVQRTQGNQADAERILSAAAAETTDAGPASAAGVSPAPPTTAGETPDPPAIAPPAIAAPPAAIAPLATAAPSAAQPGSPRWTGEAFEDLRDEAELSDKYVSIFIDEAELSLDTLTETLLALEGGGTRADLERLVVVYHRIKGSAAAVGLNRAAKLAHLLEDLLQDLVDCGGILSAELTDVMLKTTDALRQYVANLKAGTSRQDQFAALARELQTAGATVARRSGGVVSPVEAPATRYEAAEPAVQRPSSPEPQPARGIPPEFRRHVMATAPEGLPVLIGEVAFQPNLPVAGLKAQLVYHKLIKLGDVCSFSPPVETLGQLDNLDRAFFGLCTRASVAKIRGQLRIAGVQEVTIEPLGAEDARTPAALPAGESAQQRAGAAPVPVSADASRAAAPSRGPGDDRRPSETLRVDVERLDHLMDLAGQLAINKARILQITESMNVAMRNRRSSEAVNMLHDLLETVHQFDRISGGIQQSVMDIRMVPIGPLFARFKRVIRDITRSNGKSIRLVIKGEKTELDKRMIDELGDPLIHMIRNAADHGIESPEVRRAAGKPPEGTIELDAFHRGNSIVIQVSDDGKGLDPDRILRKCLEKGFLTQADADKMTPNQICQMIWQPGVSTADKVSEVSGRGMGMDIVKSKIEGLNGTIDLDSQPGKGTTLTIRLPLTLAILPSLKVVIDDEVFSVPIDSVAEIVTLGRDGLATVHGRWTACVRGRVLALATLQEVFHWNESRSKAVPKADEKTTLVVVRETGRELALAVDRVLGEEDVVIKSIAENYRNVEGVAGAAILGDGRVSLILDIGALIDMSFQSNNDRKGAKS